MKEIIPINLNDYVYVKLDERGYQILYDHWHRYDNIVPNPDSYTLDELKGKADKDGYTQFQWHTFMEIYGEHFTHDVGGFKSAGIDPNVLIMKPIKP